MNATELVRFFDDRRQRDDPLVLVTVFDTRGSTYSKAGAQMLIDRDGRFQGMLSGGCLEGDLAIRAVAVIDSGVPQVVTYDLTEDDALWGLGVGCEGAMRVILQPLTATQDYQPFSAIAGILQGDVPGRLAIVIESQTETVAPGAAAVRAAGGVEAVGMSPGLAERLTGRDRAAGLVEVPADGGVATVLLADLPPPPRLLVLGAGMDAEPVVRLARELGWRCTVVDHRDAYIDRGQFAGAEEVLRLPADGVDRALDLSRFDAAIVMSHHLVSDRNYLRQLAATDIGYIGLLGPPSRRERLLAELGDDGAGLQDRLHGPAGLDIGGRGPGAIALSIIAEMQASLHRKRA